MKLIHDLAFQVHVVVGAMALLIFWVPLIVRKGSLDHRRFGRWFASLMYAVAGTGLLMSLLDLYQPLAMHVTGLSLDTEAGAAAAAELRGWAWFLFSLSVLVLTTTRHGWLVVQHKQDRSALRSPVHLGLCSLLVLVGVLLLWQAMLRSEVLMAVFGGFEVFLGLSYLHYIFKPSLAPKEWWTEHLGALIGSGIGAYTAFLVFGGNTLFQSIFGGSFSTVSIVLWIMPGLIGGVAIAWLTRYYRRRFGAGSVGGAN